MASAYARSSGANARAIDWDAEDHAQPSRKGRGNWLPLDALDRDDDVYAGTPRLQQTAAAPRPGWLRPTAPQPAQPRTAQHPQQIPATRPQAQINVGAVKAKTLAVAAGVLVFALAAYVAVNSALDWTRVKMDDLQYGRPRTMQIDAYVGHNEAEGMPSHFIAMNLNRRVTILQLQGGDPAKAATIVGPYLFGQGEDLTPVQLDVQDLNTDCKPDLIVDVKSEQLLYLNDGAAFRLATPEERTAIERAAARPQTAGVSAPEPGAGEGTK
jgi:hypothetical protein